MPDVRLNELETNLDVVHSLGHGWKRIWQSPETVVASGRRLCCVKMDPDGPGDVVYRLV